MGRAAPTAGAGTFNLASGGTLSIKLGTVNDSVNVTGTISLDGASSLTGSLLTGFTATTNGGLFFIGLNDGTDGIRGTFGGLAQGSTVTFNGPGGTQAFTISYTADSAGNTFTGGNDIALLAAVPEPSIWMATIFGALGLLVGLRRVRQRQLPA